MERKVARAQGERSQEEMQKLTKDIDDKKAQQKEQKENLQKLLNSNKSL